MNLQESIKGAFQRFKNNQDPGEDDFVIVNARKRKRVAKANLARQQRRGRRAFVRRELAKEREQNQLAQLFNIMDRLVSSSSSVLERAQVAIGARVDFLVDQGDLDAAEALQRLRGIAKTAPTRVPKVKQYDQGGFSLPSGASWVRNGTNQAEPVIYTGRGA